MAQRPGARPPRLVSSASDALSDAVSWVAEDAASTSLRPISPKLFILMMGDQVVGDLSVHGASPQDVASGYRGNSSLRGP